MADSAMRLIACAGLLATGLLVGGAGAGIAVADPGDSTGGGAEGTSVTSKVDGGSGGASEAAKPDPPMSTVDSGRDDVDVTSADEDKKNGFPTGSKKFKGSITIPILRIPRKSELPASGLPNPNLFYTTLVIPVPTLADVLSAMQPQPAPSPAPGPAFRTQEEGPPVADSSGGGGDPLSTGVAAEPPVLRAPMVIAPLPIPLPPAPAPLGASAATSPAQVVVADTVAVGASAPTIRGSLPPTVDAPAGSLTPMSGQATRLGYPRYLRSPTAGELAALALPGVTGLLFITFGGGFVGYRQANSVRFIRAQGAERFLR